MTLFSSIGSSFCAEEKGYLRPFMPSLIKLTLFLIPTITGRIPAKASSSFPPFLSLSLSLSLHKSLCFSGLMEMEVAEREETEAEAEAEELPCPRDLLRRLAGTKCSDEHPAISPGSGEMDLRLGLSLGGCFAGEKRLVRSSSIAALSIFPTEKDFPPAASPLARTCSLPVEADQENRKRKELQSLKRLEAKRKREEKRTFLRPGAADAAGELCGGVPPRATGARPALRRTSSSFDAGGSRGVPEILVLNNNNNNNNKVAGNNSSLPSTPDTNHKPATTTTPPASSLRSLKSLGEDAEAMKRMMSRVSKDMQNSIMEEMPCVSTKGDGPNGKRIEGFLYRYKKGEDVSIVCVCHGSFLTPAEFIKHAGGGDVDHPLRHIVVNPSTSLPPYY